MFVFRCLRASGYLCTSEAYFHSVFFMLDYALGYFVSLFFVLMSSHILSQCLSTYFLHIVFAFLFLSLRTVSFSSFAPRFFFVSCEQVSWNFFFKPSRFLNNWLCRVEAEWARQAGRWSRRDGAFLFHREWFETKGEGWGRDNWVCEGTGKLYRD